MRYGSILILETARPAVLSSNPQLLAMMPLPTPEMTPAKNQRKRNGRKTRKDHYLQRPERTSSWLIEIRLYYSKVALLVKTREGGEEKKRERKVVAGPLQSMKEKKKKVDKITCFNLSSLSYHQSGELTRHPSTILQATGGIMTQDSILNFREYGGLPCFSLLEQNDTNQLLIDISRDQALSR